MTSVKPKPAWLILAIASGACAACNGVFAKLTTTELTTSWASAIATAFSLSPGNKLVEYLIRGLFFLLNLLFNAIMWTLFTRALTLASSTVRVSIINTSANFIVTAFLSFLVFSESLPGLWWLGAALLVAGSVIIGRREEANKAGVEATTGIEPLLEGEQGSGAVNKRTDEEGYKDDDEDSPAGERVELNSVRGGSESEDEDGVLK